MDIRLPFSGGSTCCPYPCFPLVISLAYGSTRQHAPACLAVILQLPSCLHPCLYVRCICIHNAHSCTSCTLSLPCSFSPHSWRRPGCARALAGCCWAVPCHTLRLLYRSSVAMSLMLTATLLAALLVLSSLVQHPSSQFHCASVYLSLPRTPPKSLC